VGESTATLLLSAAGVVVAVVAAVAGIVAAIYAVRLWRAGRRDLEPRPRASFTDSVATVQAQIGNPGGASLSTWILVLHAGSVWVWTGNLPEHSSQLLSFSFTRVGPPTTPAAGSPVVVLSTARDSDRRAWDCLRAKRIKGRWEKWANGELKRLGLAGLVFKIDASGDLRLHTTTPSAS
jgi:hypothetical protein